MGQVKECIHGHPSVLALLAASVGEPWESLGGWQSPWGILKMKREDLRERIELPQAANSSGEIPRIKRSRPLGLERQFSG